MSTLTGRLLRIDLSNSKFKAEEIPNSLYRDFISARGLGAYYLYKELNANIDPLSPENKIIMSIGVLGGTRLQGFSKWAVSSKSPLTGTIFRSITGGNFGVWMKHAGYDLIIIEGKAQTPSYVHIDGDGVHFIDAKSLLGLDARSLQLKLKERHGAHTESACIGIAGERLIRYAVITSGERTAARGGMGTVMGAKNLKAVSINFSVKKLTAFDGARFESLVKKQINILKVHPRRKDLTTIGTPYITTAADAWGILPTKNFQEGSIQNVEAISGDEFYKIKRAKAGCHVCLTRCGGMRDVTKGPLKDSQIDGPEYETIYAFGPLIGITDRQFVVNANALCDFYGIDTISTGVSIAFACELFEKGILSITDTDGLDLTWGNKPAVFSLIKKIGKADGIGRLLGHGVKKAAQEIGGQAEYYAMHIKGLELPGYDPRGVKGYALSMATSNIGGSHMYGRPRNELTGEVDPFTEEGKGESIAQVQKEQALEDSLIACTFGNSGLDPQTYSELLSSATGIEDFANVDNLFKVGERIICLERCFNVRDGFRRKDDCLPKRMISEPLRSTGPSNGQVVMNLNKLLDEYYEALGYSEDGMPTIEKIENLRLKEVIKTLSPTH